MKNKEPGNRWSKDDIEGPVVITYSVQDGEKRGDKIYLVIADETRSKRDDIHSRIFGTSTGGIQRTLEFNEESTGSLEGGVV